MISMALARAVSENIRAGRQSILLLNRRGYHTYAVCKDCKTVAACPNCSISMTYHAANNRLMCTTAAIPNLLTCAVRRAAVS